MNCACKAGTGFQHSENLIQGICFNMAVGKRSAGNTCIIGLIRDVKHGIEVALNQCLVDPLVPGLVKHFSRKIQSIDYRIPMTDQIRSHKPGATAYIQDQGSTILQNVSQDLRYTSRRNVMQSLLQLLIV